MSTAKPGGKGARGPPSGPSGPSSPTRSSSPSATPSSSPSSVRPAPSSRRSSGGRRSRGTSRPSSRAAGRGRGKPSASTTSTASSGRSVCADFLAYRAPNRCLQAAAELGLSALAERFAGAGARLREGTFREGPSPAGAWPRFADSAADGLIRAFAERFRAARAAVARAALPRPAPPRPALPSRRAGRRAGQTGRTERERRRAHETTRRPGTPREAETKGHTTPQCLTEVCDAPQSGFARSRCHRPCRARGS